MSEHGTGAAGAPRRGRLAGHVVLAAASLLALAISLRLGLWRQGSPGEGLFPFLTAFAMAAFSVAGLIGDLRQRAPAHDRLFGGRAGLLRVAAYLGALVFFAAVARTARLHRRIDDHARLHPALRRALRVVATLALTAGTVVGCQILFVLWLGAILPTGTLWAELLQR